MIIRPEQESDFAAIYSMVKRAFETAPFTDGDEHDYINLLRANWGYRPDLALVAEDDGAVIGHIMLIETYLKHGRERYPVLLLEPLSVAVGRHSQGVGGALITEALKRAREQGYAAVFLTGDPGYYRRFGFKAAAEFGVGHTLSIPDDFLLGLELRPGTMRGKQGIIEIL